MAIYASTCFFECLENGWSETWYRDTSQTDLQAIGVADAQATGLWGARLKMLCAPARMLETRTSFVDVKNDAWPQNIRADGPAPYASAHPGVCVLWRFSGAGQAKWKNVYLRGVPDDISLNGGVIQLLNPTLAAWFAAAGAYATILSQQNWGWISRKATDPLKKKAIGYGQWVENERYIHVGLEVLAAPNQAFPDAQVGTDQLVNFVGANKPEKSRLNGRHVVYVVDNSNCVLNTPLSLFAWNGKPFTMQRYTPTLVTVTNSAARKIVTRDTGKISGVRRGRALARARG